MMNIFAATTITITRRAPWHEFSLLMLMYDGEGLRDKKCPILCLDTGSSEILGGNIGASWAGSA